MALIGKVISMTGVATILNDKGDKRALNPGDSIQTGDTIQTAAGVDVDVQLANGRVIHIGADQMVAFTPELAEVFAPTEADSAVNLATIDTVIQAIEGGKDINAVLEETAAGSAQNGHGTYNVDRINELLTTLGFPNEGNGAAQVFQTGPVAAQIDSGNITPDTEAEGTSLVHTVNLFQGSGGERTFTLTIGGGTATAGQDYSTTYVFSDDRITFDERTGKLTVPAGITTFTITVNSLTDNEVEGNETYNITLTDSRTGQIFTATGTIVDSVPTTTTPIVTSVQAGSDNIDKTNGLREGSEVTEGQNLLYKVTLNGAPTTATEVTLNLTSGNGTLGTDTTTPIKVSFDGGVTYTNVTGTTVTVPAGSASFIISLPTVDDNLVEKSETILFTASTANNTQANTPAAVTGTILDNDPIVTSVQAGSDNIDPTNGLREGSVVTEGEPLLYKVTLNGTTITDTQVNLNLTNGSGTVGTDTTIPIKVSFDGGLTFTNVTGTTVTVPAGSTSFIISLPTVDDNLVEKSETILFTASTANNTTANTPAAVTGTILDNDPIVTSVQAGSDNIDPTNGLREGSVVTEGQNLLYKVTLNGAPTTATEVTLNLTSGTGTLGTDTKTPIKVSFDGGVTYTNVTGTTVTVPAGSTSFIISLPTVDDTIVEPKETIFFTASTIHNDATHPAPSAVVGTILDNDGDGFPISVKANGLTGEYYGYNDSLVQPGNRIHADDNSNLAKVNQFSSTNLDAIKDVENIINGRQGATIAGTGTAAATDVPDVRFQATNIDYALKDSAGNLTNESLGSNNTDNKVDTSDALGRFLGADAASAVIEKGSPVPGSSGLGQTTDAIIRMTGSVYLERGNYDFRVYADDGFNFKVGGQTLLEFDGNQSPTVREFKNLNIDGVQSGLTPIELLYWEQGGNGVLKIEYKLSSDADYKTFSLDNLAMFSTADTPVLTDTRLQDIVQDINGNYVIRSGVESNGTNAVDTMNGTEGKDFISGFNGNDVLSGLGGADFLSGGAGNDTINGGAGNDILDGGTGVDTMIGGAGDDIYRIDDAGEFSFIQELPNEGTDTLEINIGSAINYTIAQNFENVTLSGNANSNITGNAADNRIIGNEGNNILDGAAGDDRIIGGAGNDTLTGGTGKDVFEWNLADKGSVGVPAVDHITDFVYTGNGGTNPNVAATLGTDSIDLRDLLQGEASNIVDANFNAPDIGTLQNYLNFEVSGGSTTINISSSGQFANGVYDASKVDQKIVLDNVNLFNDTSAGTSQFVLLQKLLANGSLIVD